MGDKVLMTDACVRLANQLQWQHAHLARTIAVFVVDVAERGVLIRDAKNRRRETVVQTRTGTGRRSLKLLYRWQDLRFYTKRKADLNARVEQLTMHGAIVRAAMRYVQAEQDRSAATALRVAVQL